MASLGAIIPPELLENILHFIGDESLLLETFDEAIDFNMAARREEMKYLSNCAMTCVFWAKAARQRMFQVLILRARSDFRELEPLFYTPPSPRLLPVGRHIREIVVFYNLGEYPWFLDAARFKCKDESVSADAEGVASDQRDVLPFQLEIVLSGPAPSESIPRNSWRTARHPLFFAIPRVVPGVLDNLGRCLPILQDIHFPNFRGLENLLREFPGSWDEFIRYCINVTWDTGPIPLLQTLALATALSSPNMCNYSTPSTAAVHTSGCTDDVLVALAVHHSQCSITGRSYSLLHPVDCTRLYEAIHLTYDNVLDSDSDDLPHSQLCLNYEITWPWPDFHFGRNTRVGPTQIGHITWNFQHTLTHRDAVVFSCLTAMEPHGNTSTISRINCLEITLGYAVSANGNVSELELDAYDWAGIIGIARRFPMLGKIEVRATSYKLLVAFVKLTGDVLHTVEDIISLRYHIGVWQGGLGEATLKEVEDAILSQEKDEAGSNKSQT